MSAGFTPVNFETTSFPIANAIQPRSLTASRSFPVDFGASELPSAAIVNAERIAINGSPQKSDSHAFRTIGRGVVISAFRRSNRSFCHISRNVLFPAPKGAFTLTTKPSSTKSCSISRYRSSFSAKGFVSSLSSLKVSARFCVICGSKGLIRGTTALVSA